MQPKTPLFTSGSQHPPRFGHAVYLGETEDFPNVGSGSLYSDNLPVKVKVEKFIQPIGNMKWLIRLPDWLSGESVCMRSRYRMTLSAILCS